eukprot:scaffold200402_cov17-Tisochrysis_lutea.AAC.1
MINSPLLMLMRLARPRIWAAPIGLRTCSQRLRIAASAPLALINKSNFHLSASCITCWTTVCKKFPLPLRIRANCISSSSEQGAVPVRGTHWPAKGTLTGRASCAGCGAGCTAGTPRRSREGKARQSWMWSTCCICAHITHAHARARAQHELTSDYREMKHEAHERAREEQAEVQNKAKDAIGDALSL